jgi:hypothetical protein
MKYEKPELVIDTKELPRVTVNFAQPPSEGWDKGHKTIPFRVSETPVSDSALYVTKKTQK